MTNDTLKKLSDIKDKMSEIYEQFLSATSEMSEVWEEFDEDLKEELIKHQLDFENNNNVDADEISYLVTSIGKVSNYLKWRIEESNMTFEKFKALAEKIIIPQDTSMFVIEKYNLRENYGPGYYFDISPSYFAIAPTFETAKQVIADNSRKGIEYRADACFYLAREYDNQRFMNRGDYLRIWLFDNEGKEVGYHCSEEVYKTDAFRGYIGGSLKPGEIAIALNLRTDKGYTCVITEQPYTIEQCWEERKRIIQTCKANGCAFNKTRYNEIIGKGKDCYRVYCDEEPKLEKSSPVLLLPIEGLQSPHLSDWYNKHIASKTDDPNKDISISIFD